ncbi:MAG: hypothetical protein APF84_00265 [Gracilibacter sp. BRH_c7a]|nr:MAG: hypothetical protein APF84_00265 [Gracilibacter sp. BRH_c7a]
MLAEKEKLNNDPEAAPSVESVRRFSRQLNARINKNKALAARQRLLKILNRSAIAMLAVIVILGTTVASVEAVKVRVLNLWLEIKPEYTSFQLTDSGSNSDREGPDSTSPPVSWTKAHVPTYIPDGYTVNRVIDHEFYKKIIFENEQGLFIFYSELGEGSNAAVDTENADVFETISINGHQGTLIEKNALVTIVWAMDNRMFIVQSQTSAETALKIAEGVKYVE